MQGFRKTGSLVSLVATGILLPCIACAQLPASAVECRATIAKNYAKLMKTAHKTIASCHKSRDGAKIVDTTDCNDMTQADSKTKFGNARTKAIAAIGVACAAENATLTTASDGTQYYVSCPVACGVVPNPMTTMAQVADCLGCLAESVAETAGTNALGSPAPGMLTRDDIKCRSAVAKGYGKYAATGYKEETSCQGDADVLGNHDPAGCAGYDLNGKVFGALTKAGAGLDLKCASAALANLDTCAIDSIASLKSCSATIFGDAEDDVFLATYETDPTICPNSVRLRTLAGCSTLEAVAGNCSSGGETTSSSSEGWKGVAHDGDIVDAVTLALDLSCAGTPGACGACPVDGISTSNPLYGGYARCQFSPWIECSNLFGADPACGVDTCVYFASPPIPLNGGGTPLCILSRYEDHVSGNVDPDTGAASLLLQLRSLLHFGNSQSWPCPICRNDAVPQDGVTAGTCRGGERDGEACDVQGFDLSYATTDDIAPTDGLSLDCPPELFANISGSGVPRDLPLTTGSSSMPAAGACDAPLGAYNCFCGVCSLNSSVFCDTDADCSGMGFGSCGFGPGVAREPNNCADLICDTVGGQTDRGECSGELETYCDGLERADGKGVIPCGVDADCDAYITGSLDPDVWVCPNDDCGNCTVDQRPSCFRDPIAVNGTADPAAPVLAGVSCVPASPTGSINATFGLPGPTSVIMEMLLEPRY